MEDKRKLVQIADIVRDALLQLRHSRYLELMRQFSGFQGKMQELVAESRKYGLSVARRWYAAADRCTNAMSRLLGDTQYLISKAKPLAQNQPKEVPPLSSIVAELVQLEQEFGTIELDSTAETISVTTEPITLDDIYLGPFQILLMLATFSSQYSGSTYRVIALQPNPAATDENITHPHVTSEGLCEGDATVAIRTALEQGRLTDFFTMVRSILNTYNPDSPYVALSDWSGEPCYECGYVTDSEGSYWCTSCQHNFCEDCSTYCRECQETVCLSCQTMCSNCQESICPRCINECAECGSQCCSVCIVGNLCLKCHEKENDNEEQTEQQVSPEPAKTEEACPEVQSNSVGQAAALQR